MKESTRIIFVILASIFCLGLFYTGILEDLAPTDQSISFIKTTFQFFKTEIEQNSDRIFYYFVTLFGAAALHALSLYKGFKGSKSFLRRLFPAKSDTFYHRADFLISVIIGSIVGFIFFNPQSTIEGLIAGFSWQV